MTHSCRILNGLALALVFVLAACGATVLRNPLPADKLAEAEPLGIPGLRSWGDEVNEAALSRMIARRGDYLKTTYGPAVAAGKVPELHYLAISGGGQWGAFTAGVLNAWTESGTRPEFTGVSGVSTGAIIAPFAFLGSDYDDVLMEVYSAYDTEDLLERTIFSGIFSGASLMDTSKLRGIIAEKVTPELLARIAAEHRKGRFLLVGTTNLDARRPVVWNMGAIAASGDPGALNLFRQVILASASIPVAFPPVKIKVETPDGKVYDELHVDGGTTSDVTFISPQIPIREATVAALGRNLDRHLYLIMNTDIVPPYKPVRARTTAIGPAALGTLLRSNAIGDMYRFYLISQRDDVDYNAAWIPANLPCAEPEEAFDQAFMRCLYDVGADMFRAGDFWRDLPPHYVRERR